MFAETKRMEAKGALVLFRSVASGVHNVDIQLVLSYVCTYKLLLF